MKCPLSTRTAVIVLLALLMSTNVFAAVTAPSNSDYTALPPFLPSVVPPNILLLVDNSGSMDDSAYHQSTSEIPAQPTGSDIYDPMRAYGGYFDNTMCYTYGSSRFTPGITRPAPGSGSTCGGNNQWDGNFLNYVTMTRIEIVKWVMMGGKCSPRAVTTASCYPGGKMNLENSSRDQVGIMISATGLVPSSVASGTKCFFRSNANLRVQSLSGGSCPVNSSSGTAYSLTVDISSEPSGIIQAIGNKARFGLMEFKSGSGSTSDGGKIQTYVGDNTVSMITGIENTSANTWTPLAESLYEATRYFAQIPPAFPGSDYAVNTNNDPYYFKAPWASNPGTYVPCCKSFVIVFTDGQPTMDTNIPAGLMDYAHTVGNHGTSLHCNVPAGCTSDIAAGNGPPPKHAENYPSPSITDHDNTINEHHDNCSKYYGGDQSDPCQYSGGHYLDDVAYYAHTTNLRPQSGNLPVLGVPGTPIPGDSPTNFHNLTVYTFFAFGTGSNILKDTAKLGGFDDINGNNIPDLQQEWDKVNNYTGAKGPDGLPDTYFESSNADDLKDKLLATINSILQRSASGTAASVLSSSSTGEGAIYQASFFPQVTEGLNTILWTGYTQGLWVDKFGNIREDTIRDQKLVYKDDYILTWFLDPVTQNVKVHRYQDLDEDGKADPILDTNGDGKPDTPQPVSPDIDLTALAPIWEAGTQLAIKDAVNRHIWTWVDRNNDGIVGNNEFISFDDSNATLLKPYLAASASPFDEHSLIKWVRGDDVTDSSGNLLLRDRSLTVGGYGKKIWKLGDIINSSPTVSAAPRERYDLIYGDPTYQEFYKKYANRRQVIFAGANDGMLHAFNGGFYTAGDDPSTTTKVEHGYFSVQRATNPVSYTGPLGDEMFAFIPMELLPHLRWLASENYSHVYYVDLKPRITDVRIFCDSGGTVESLGTPCVQGQAGVDHPNGWGTILIIGFRFGGSCGAANCQSANNAVRTMTVTSDFSDPPNGNMTDPGDTRNFYSAYVVLDITDPEVFMTTGPKLLWSFTDPSLGFTTSYPTVARVKPPCTTSTCKNWQAAGAKWYILFGSGPTNYKVDTIKQGSRVFVFDLTTTPSKTVFDVSTQFSPYPAVESFIGDVVTVDKDIDYLVDVMYGGSLIKDSTSPWKGEMYRLTTPCPGMSCSTNTWGVSGTGNRTPTKIISTFGGNPVGPVTAAPSITMDDANNLWVFFGTGRFYDSSDKSLAEQQYFFGIKDSVFSMAPCPQSGATSCIDNNLVDVSNAQVFTDNTLLGITAGGLSPSTLIGNSSSSLQGLIASTYRGWVTKLMRPSSPPLERVLVKPTVIGGIVFFPSFVPDTTICSSNGSSYLYALFYQTGTAWNQNVIGLGGAGGNQVNSSMYLGAGQTGQLSVHIGAEGSGSMGSTSSPSGCAGRVTIVGQSTLNATTVSCVKTQPVWSRYLSWNNQRL